MVRFPNFIDGERVESSRVFPDIDPSTGRAYGEVCDASADDVDRAVAAARAALRGPWGRSTEAERARLMCKIADAVDARSEELVSAEVLDAGMPVSLARAVGVPRCAATLRTFAELLSGIGGEYFETRSRGGPAASNYTSRVPVGVVAAICPWNLPLLLLSWKVAPALAMGNTVVLKPSEHTPATATLFAEIARDAGLPPGVLNVVQGYGAASAGEALTRHPGVDAISFTGESSTGQEIQRAAAPTLKRLSLELGGKNPAVVFADCDLEATVAGCARSVFAHAGQICLSTERIYVERTLFERFVEAMKVAAQRVRVGDPRLPETVVGPVISADQRERVLGYYGLAIEEGANVVAGGGRARLDGELASGSFVEPTVWTGLRPTARAAREEIFGPVCHIAPFDGEEEAIHLANDSSFGLSATVWTRDLSRAHRVARALEVGTTWVNTWMVRDLRVPFGGMKRSGVGREGGRSSFDFFSEQRNVCMELS